MLRDYAACIFCSGVVAFPFFNTRRAIRDEIVNRRTGGWKIYVAVLAVSGIPVGAVKGFGLDVERSLVAQLSDNTKETVATASRRIINEADPTGVRDSTQAFFDAVQKMESIFVGTGIYRVDPDRVDLKRFTGEGIILAYGQRIGLARDLLQRSDMRQRLGNEVDLSAVPDYIHVHQGFAYSEGLDGVPHGYILLNSGGQKRIAEFPYSGDGSITVSTVYSQQLTTLGHQSLSALIEGGQQYLYSSSSSGRGVTKIHWRGAETADEDVQKFELFGEAGAGHKFENYRVSTVAVSTDRRLLLVIATRVRSKGKYWLLVYDRKEVESARNSLTIEPLRNAMLPGIGDSRSGYSQGLASDGVHIYQFSGGPYPFHPHVLRKFDIDGNLLSSSYVDDVRGLYTRAQLLGHPKLGMPRIMEPEGLALRGNALLLYVNDTWRSYGDIVSFEGKNYACRVNNTGKPPLDPEFWTPTSRAATIGPWQTTTSCVRGSTPTRYGEVIMEVGPARGMKNERLLDTGLIN